MPVSRPLLVWSVMNKTGDDPHTPMNARRRLDDPGGGSAAHWVALTVMAALTFSLTACGGEEAPEETPASPTATVTATPTPTPTPTPTVTETVEAEAQTVAEPETPVYDEQAGVREAIARYYATYNRLAQDPAANLLEMADVALNPEKDLVIGRLTANRQAGHRQVGNLQIEVMSFLPLDSAVRYLADVCVDARSVDVIDGQGHSLLNPDTPRRTASLFYVERRGTNFIVSEVNHSMDPCE